MVKLFLFLGLWRAWEHMENVYYFKMSKDSLKFIWGWIMEDLVQDRTQADWLFRKQWLCNRSHFCTPLSPQWLRSQKGHRKQYSLTPSNIATSPTAPNQDLPFWRPLRSLHSSFMETFDPREGKQRNGQMEPSLIVYLKIQKDTIVKMGSIPKPGKLDFKNLDNSDPFESCWLPTNHKILVLKIQ